VIGIPAAEMRNAASFRAHAETALTLIRSALAVPCPLPRRSAVFTPAIGVFLPRPPNALDGGANVWRRVTSGSGQASLETAPSVLSGSRDVAFA
jgi:hypothetical protein